MPIMGSLGDIVFSVSPEVVNTLDNITWSSSARYGEHKRHLRDPILEFTGTDSDSFTFDLTFSAFLGVKPMDEVKKLLNAERKGMILPLYIGTKGYGLYRWVLTKVVFKLRNYDNKGNLVYATAAVTLRSYGER